MRNTLYCLLVLFFFHICAFLYAGAVDAELEFIELPNTKGYTVDVNNKELFPIYLYIDFSLVGYEPSIEIPVIIELNVGINKDVMQLYRMEGHRSFSYSVEYLFMLANPESTVIEDFLYYFPFEHGTAHRIGQGWNGTFSHRGQNEYAVDFDMDEGTVVYAARAGMVVSVKEDSKIGGASAAYADHTNYILIRHDDNSFAHYVHLQYNGSLVEKGDRVEAGDRIGLSGNTGVSTGPHLHFDVRVYKSGGKLSSIPFHFRGKNDMSVQPLKGRTYYAYHPGYEDFIEMRGANINVSDYDDYSKILETHFLQSKVSIRTKTYDDRLVAFIANGNAVPIHATVSLGLSNLESVLGNPISIRLQAREERFLTILLIQDLAESYGMSSRIRYKK